jgi:hypothetical protein
MFLVPSQTSDAISFVPSIAELKASVDDLNACYAFSAAFSV